MNTTKIIGIVLLIASLGIGYMGIDKVSQSNNSVKLLGLEIGVSNDSQRQEGYLYIGFAVLLFVGGLYTLNKK
jgi:hypothetical protein